MLAGAKEMDAATTQKKQPSCFVGARLVQSRQWSDMVVLPYKDSLLFSRYLKLVMESQGEKTWTVRLSTKELLSMETKARPINTPMSSSCAKGVPNSS